MQRFHSALLLAFAVAPLSAQDPAPRRVEFTGDIGFVNTAGNTETTTFNVGEKLTYRLTSFTVQQFFAVVHGSTDGQTTNGLWRTGLRGDYTLTPRLLLYGSVGFDRNRFAGIQRRFEEGLGAGVKVLTGERDKLEFEAGVAFTQQRSTLDVEDKFTSARAAGTFKHGFTESAYFQQLVEVLPNLEETDDLRINTETALVAPLSKRLAVKVSYVIRYDKLPAPGFKTTDRLLTSGVQISL